ncbi:MAG: putative MerR family transcriptional regulator [Rhodoglobus sp.]|nr:putative MerR family transcriptional regulator [Rhodoglobus sp.]
MRVSELVERTGIPLATIKYYLREGLLMPGTATSATQAVYGEHHVRRLALIRALTEVVGLTVQKAGEVIRLIDSPEPDLFETLGKAVAALPPYLDDLADDYPRARAALERIGQVYDPEYAAVGQFERALAAAEAVGLPMSEERLDGYASHVMGIAEIDIGGVPAESPGSAVEYAVLGTAIYEPILAAMRRLAHQDLASRRLAAGSTSEQ